MLLFNTPDPSQSQLKSQHEINRLGHDHRQVTLQPDTGRPPIELGLMVVRKELAACASHSKPFASVSLLKLSSQASSVAQLHTDAQDVALSSMSDPISATTSCDRPSAVSSYHQLQARCDVLLGSLPYADNGAAQNAALLLARANRELRVQIALLQAQLSPPTTQRPSPRASQLTLRERAALAECESPPPTALLPPVVAVDAAEASELLASLCESAGHKLGPAAAALPLHAVRTPPPPACAPGSSGADGVVPIPMPSFRRPQGFRKELGASVRARVERRLGGGTRGGGGSEKSPTSSLSPSSPEPSGRHSLTHSRGKSPAGVGTDAAWWMDWVANGGGGRGSGGGGGSGGDAGASPGGDRLGRLGGLDRLGGGSAPSPPQGAGAEAVDWLEGERWELACRVVGGAWPDDPMPAAVEAEALPESSLETIALGHLPAPCIAALAAAGLKKSSALAPHASPASLRAALHALAAPAATAATAATAAAAAAAAAGDERGATTSGVRSSCGGLSSVSASAEAAAAARFSTMSSSSAARRGSDTGGSFRSSWNSRATSPRSSGTSLHGSSHNKRGSAAHEGSSPPRLGRGYSMLRSTSEEDLSSDLAGRFDFDEPDLPGENIVYSSAADDAGLGGAQQAQGWEAGREVRCATLHKLVQVLTHHEKLDAPFAKAFMLTFHSFTSPLQLLQLLQAHTPRSIRVGQYGPAY